MTASDSTPRRPGGQPGNTANLRNGSRADRTAHRLQLGELPKPMARVTRDARAYRRALEAAVLEQHGEISLTHAHWIDAAAGFEAHAAVCRWVLRQKLDAMSASDIIAASREMARSRERRNAALKELGLDRPDDDDVAALYSLAPEPDEAETTGDSPDD